MKSETWTPLEGKAPEYTPLCGAVKQIAVGYLLLHLNLHLGRLNLLPDWLGYLLILDALPILSEEQPPAALLRPLGKLLAAYGVLEWAAELLDWSIPIPAPGLVVGVVSLYFHFQLLTDLSNLARKHHCPEERKLLRLRTVRTVVITLFRLPLPWESHTHVSTALAVCGLIIALWTCATLFSLRSSLAIPGEEELSAAPDTRL